MKLFFKCVIPICGILLYLQAFPCTEFRLQSTTDKTTLVSRTMEFGVDMHSSIKTSNRNRVFRSSDYHKNNTITWKAKYGYVYFDAFNLNFAVDGMNEKGLSFSALYFSGFAQYQTPFKTKRYQHKNLPYFLIGDWILSNFSTIQEVKENIQQIRVIAQQIPQLKDVEFPLHFSVYDAEGNGLVIEYTKKLHLYENQIGVFTNSPTFGWHLNNLQNYNHLNPYNPKLPTWASNNQNFTVQSHGQGFGLVGLPGDPTPPSRFVMIATMLRFMTPPTTADKALNLANHIMNKVDIPEGLVRSPNEQDPETGRAMNDTTQWVAFKDLTNKILYFRTYTNLNLRSIHLDKLDFSPNVPTLNLQVMDNQTIQDITDTFISTKNKN